MSRFLFLLLLFSTAAFAQPRPNVLWILGEDMSPDLGFLGTPEVRTPILDDLAARGVYYSNAFTTAPVCSPSRSAFTTGMYQVAIGAHNHRSHRPDSGSPYPWPLPEGVRTISDWMRHAGYFTGNIRALDEGLDFTGTGKTDWNFTYDGEPFDTDQWTDLKDNQPFYAQVNFPETHRGNAWDISHERIPNPADPAKVELPPYYPDHPVVRDDWAQYLNAVMSLDQKVGVVLDLLERDGMSDNTIVIFMGDHGRAMLRGKQWPYDSGLKVPLMVYWPEALNPPADYHRGTVNDDLVAAIDLAPTSIAMAGMPKPEAMHGRVFLGPNREAPRDVVFGGRDRGDETVDRIRTVRSKRFRYIRNYYPDQPLLQMNRYKEASYPMIWAIREMQAEGKLNEAQAYLLAPTRPAEELYDILHDPWEINNLADSPAHQEIKADLSAQVDGWMESVGDDGAPEPAEVVEYYTARGKRNYDARIEALREKWKQ